MRHLQEVTRQGASLLPVYTHTHTHKVGLFRDWNVN